MSVHVSCPSCGQTYALTEDEAPRFAGRSIECAQCNASFTVPASVAPPPRRKPAVVAAVQPRLPRPHVEVTAGAYSPALAGAATLPITGLAAGSAYPGPFGSSDLVVHSEGNAYASASVICGLIGLIVPIMPSFLAIVLGLAGLGRAKRTNSSGDLSACGIITGVLTMIFGAAVLHSYILPAIAQARQQSVDARCAEHLSTIGKGLNAYAARNGGAYPARIEQAVASGDVPASALICGFTLDTPAPGNTPAQRAARIPKGHHCSYIYVGAGLTTSSPAECVLMYEPMERHHETGITVLFADGRVSPIGQLEGTKAVKRLNAGQNPPWTEIAPK